MNLGSSESKHALLLALLIMAENSSVARDYYFRGGTSNVVLGQSAAAIHLRLDHSTYRGDSPVIESAGPLKFPNLF